MKSVLPPLRPAASAKLFVFGATIGPIVDSFHNQCLLRYDLAPIAVPWPSMASSLAQLFEQDYLLCSSWSVPLLLGVAYVVLGDLLPRLFQWILSKFAEENAINNPYSTSSNLRLKAILAVLTTALVIKLSQYLELHQPFLSLLQQPDTGIAPADANYLVLLLTTLLQWWALDGTPAALLAAGITSIGGPLSELPFVAHGFWHYIPEAADYQPLANIAPNGFLGASLLSPLLGEDFSNLALSSITGPCYFAVTLDAIALGRWFQQQPVEKEKKE